MVEGSSSSSINDNKYDVLLSFRGADTRLGFTAQLYEALENANIHTFLDSEEIEKGRVLKTDLERAIKESKLSIVLLSKNYATSTWCLHELVKILGKPNHTVIPIFFYVTPAHVRWLEQSFGDAMAKYEEEMKAEKDPYKRRDKAEEIKRWRSALREVADKNGYEVKDRQEMDVIHDIVKDIYRRLPIDSRSSMPQLFGMDNHIKIVSSWLKDASSDTGDMLTILGMGGIGKTSLAAHVYELHSMDFQKKSFTGDITRACEKHDGLLNLQKNLLDDILNRRSVQTHRESEYTSMIESVLLREKVFLILDDIDSLDQLKALIGTKGLHAGSKIIITTRFKQVTESCTLLFNTENNVKPNHSNHMLDCLNKTESRQLLCHHAFMSKYPKAGYEKVLEKFVEYCEGNPLALEILGKNLRKQDVDYWEGELDVIRKENNSPTNNILKRSFDSLRHKDDKDLFKHIACFFVGMDIDDTETILNACGIKIYNATTNLIERGLLSIGWNNKLMMHHLIQEMGKYIVRKESEDDPGERSRIWCHEESLEVLKKKTGTKIVQGLTLDTRMLKNKELHERVELETDALSKMHNLKLLQLNYVKMKGSYEKFPEELRWLCMHGFPSKSIPLDLPMENLVVLDMSHSKIESFDTCYSNPQQPQEGKKLIASCSKDKGLLGSLKILDLSFGEKLCRLGRFDGLTALEKLIVTDCHNLVEVNESIKECVELVYINLSDCSKLKKLPRTLGNLKKVEELILDGCNFGQDQEAMDSSVSNIDINTGTSSSSILKVKPRVVESFKFLPSSLVRLSLADNKLLAESFPEDLSFLSKLKYLCLNDNLISFMPKCLRRLPQLEELIMAGCHNLTLVDHPPRTLRYLNLLSIYGYLQHVVFDQDMSPLRLGMMRQQIAIPCDIGGILKIQRMKEVEEKVLDSLGWTNPDFPYKKCMEMFFVDKKPEESKNKMCYEFGIFSTHYIGKQMPNWIICKDTGKSILFTIPPSRNKFRGLNVCSVHDIESSFRYGRISNVTMIKISNITKKLTWIYSTSFSKFRVDREFLILLSHWMFGMNEMEAGDEVTITGTTGIGHTKECGVGFVYDDGNNDEEEDVLGYYKSWNHIIGKDLTGFQLTTGEYILMFDGYKREGVASTRSLHEFVEEGAVYKEEQVWFRAFSQKKSDIVGHTHEEEDNGGVQENRHGFQLSALQWRKCFGDGTSDVFTYPLNMLTDLDDFVQLSPEAEMDGEEEDDAEVDNVVLISSNIGDDSSNPIVGTIQKGPSNVATNLEEVPRSLRNVSALTQHVDRGSDLSPKTFIPDSSTRNLSSTPLEGSDIPNNSKNKVLKTAEDVIQDPDKPLPKEDLFVFQSLPKEDDKDLSSRRRRRQRLIVEKEESVDGPSVNDTIGDNESSSVSHPEVISNPNEGTLVENIVEAIDATEENSKLNQQPSCGGALVKDIFAKHTTLLFDQAQKMALAANDIVELQTRYEGMESKHSALVNRLSQAESELEHLEALRKEGDKKVLSLEASNELLESEKDWLKERVAMLEAADVERVRQLEVVGNDLSVCRTDLEWVLREGLPHCFDKVLVSDAFSNAYKRVQKACIEYGKELPDCKTDTVREMNEALSSFVDMDYVCTGAELGIFVRCSTKKNFPIIYK